MKRRIVFISAYCVFMFIFAMSFIMIRAAKPKEQSIFKEPDMSASSDDQILPVESAAELYTRDGVTYLSIQGHEMLLVNKNYPLPSDYGDGLTPEVQAAFAEMKEAAYAAGYPIWIVSGYRSYATQVNIFANNVRKYGSEEEANKISARAGQSEHQSGLALDLAGQGEEVLTFEFANTPAGQWLRAHCAEYGFILRYPEDKTWATGYVYEPWHFRYVGVELAQILTDSGLSVEEYAKLV